MSSDSLLTFRTVLLYRWQRGTVEEFCRFLNQINPVASHWKYDIMPNVLRPNMDNLTIVNTILRRISE
jgi:hypothetical protein